MNPRHERIARIALTAAGDMGLALAGGYAVRAHGMGHRPSGDVDLFTDWRQRKDFPSIVKAVVNALEQNGFEVTIDTGGDTFARLTVLADDPDATADKVELSADWRTHAPMLLDIGPVLHPDDAVANKMCALFGRALARDFLDIDAALTSGRYTRERLLELAHNADGGFDPAIFAAALGALAQITDDAFAQYDIPAAEAAAMRTRFADWRAQLMA